jgi:hypothetical protein
MLLPLLAALSIPLQNAAMVPLADGVYTEPGLRPAEHRALLEAHGAAVASVDRFFGGGRHAPPLVLFCHTGACKETLGADPGTAASPDLGFARDGVQTSDGFLATRVVVVTGPVPRTQQILTHELVHAEMKAWTPYDALPTWFNEGMATWVAGEPDCTGLPQVTAFDVRALDSKQSWQAHLAATHATRKTYCAAREEVSAWAKGHPDVPAALEAVLLGKATP